jgi:uncharacterized membrane protein
MGKEARLWAKEHTAGNKWIIWQAVLIVGLISGIASGIISFLFPNPSPTETNTIGSFLSSVVSIATLPLTIGMVLYVVNVVKGRAHEIGQLFSRYKDFVRIFVSNLLVGIFVFLFTLLLIVPGIIRGISYFLVNYILADSDFDNLSAGEILDLSRKLMDGHKGEYFGMCVYYFFMMLLGCFTLGILWIWTIPQMNLAFAKFGSNLLDEYKKSNGQTAKEEEKTEE